VAICFFGLTRSLNFTAPYIISRIISPMEHFANIRIFLHTFNLSVLTNPRSSEFKVPLNHKEFVLLNPHKYEITDQEEFLRTVPANFCRKHGDNYKDGFASTTNIFCQLESLRRVTALMLEDGTEFDSVVYARPDVLYFNPVDVEQVLHAQPRTIYVPLFHRYAGLNDRFAFGHIDVMTEFGYRGSELEKYCDTNQLNSEGFLRAFLDSRKINVKATSIVFSRVRANGLVYEHPTWSFEQNRPVRPSEMIEQFI
jgi:hypothetical protein